MVLQEYDLRPVIGNEYEFTSSDNMHFCLIDARNLLESAELTHLQIRDLIKLRKDYIHYRDATIKNGEDISRFPRRIRVERHIAEVIIRLEQRDKRERELKMKFGRH